jgi:3-deoxy-D-manno-octulosonic-acid transferase
MIIIYNVVLFIFFIPALAFFAFSYGRRHKESFFYRWRERAGEWDADKGNDGRPLLWIHGASLGEMRVVEPLVRELKEYRVLVSTLTNSGREYAEKNRISDHVVFAPLDFTFLVKRAVLRSRPAALVLIETELWPGMITAAARAGLKILLVNGRMSARSYPKYHALRGFWKPLLSCMDRVAARSPEDADRFVQVGCPQAKVSITGNIKYDRAFPAPTFRRSDFALRDTDILFIAGSTRSGEEALLLEALLPLRQKYPSLKLVIAPRHLDRIPELQRYLESQGLSCRLRSAASPSTYDCLLLDTFGELQQWYALSDICYVGGSLVNKGGQNPIEPAAYGRPVFFGPDMSNFQSESNAIIKAGGGFGVKDAQELAAAVEAFVKDNHARVVAGAKARQAVEAQRGALARTAKMIRETVGR